MQFRITVSDLLVLAPTYVLEIAISFTNRFLFFPPLPKLFLSAFPKLWNNFYFITNILILKITLLHIEGGEYYDSVT